MLHWQDFFFSLPGLITVALYGAATGSFLNVVVYRIPKGISIVVPRSRCTRCCNAIRPWHNLPIVGWLILNGRCSHCRGRISARYPLVEALTAALFVLSFLRSKDFIGAVLACAIVSWALALALVDLDLRVLPDSMTLPFLAIGLSTRFVIDQALFLDGLLASVGAFLVLRVLAWLWQKSFRAEGLGDGDIRYSAALGALFGSDGILVLMFASTILALVQGLALLRSGENRGISVPFGAALSVATIVYLLGLFPHSIP